MIANGPAALSIAGFDPSGGAGVLADVKTFEAHGVYGFGVCSALTRQNDVEFDGIDWVSAGMIEQQIRTLARRFELRWVKIGLIESLDVIAGVVDLLTELDSDVRIVWDPVLRASAGFVFHASLGANEAAQLAAVCSRLRLVTPNREEAGALSTALQDTADAETADAETAAFALSRHCAVLLKGGHAGGAVARDILYRDGEQHSFESRRIADSDKHGTGCVLSAAITAGLARGATLREACARAKEYVQDFLTSAPGLLGRHGFTERRTGDPKQVQ